MASLNNYLKGNMLLQKGYHNASLETDINNLPFTQNLLAYSLQENINAKDRVILIINFEIGKHKRALYKDLAEKGTKYSDRKIVQLQQRLYLIEFGFDFDEADTKEKQIQQLNTLVEEFRQEVLKRHTLPLFLFVQGLEILEIYLESHHIYYWILKLLEEFPALKQANFLIQSDMLSKTTIKYLETVVNCRVMVENHHHSDKNVQEGLVYMALSKNSGFSYLENYRVILKGDTKIACKIEKITKQIIEAEQNEGKDMQKFFGSSFKLELSDHEKKKKENMILPHMKAQNAENVWKDFLLEVDDDFQEDPEQDEDEDLDV